MSRSSGYELGMSADEIMECLRDYDPDTPAPLGFGKAHSYRGYYECLAFEPVDDTTYGEMLAAVEGAMGQTFEGYKGGFYKMTPLTECYLAFYGESGSPITEVLFDQMDREARWAARLITGPQS